MLKRYAPIFFWFLWVSREIIGETFFGDSPAAAYFFVGTCVAPIALLVLADNLRTGTIPTARPLLLLAYLALAGLSLTWTAASRSEIALFNWLALILDVGTATAVVASDDDQPSAFRSAGLGLMLGGLAVATFVLLKFDPNYAGMRPFQTGDIYVGVNLVGNRLGVAAISATFLYLGESTRLRYLYIASLSVILVALVLSTSKTPLFCCAIVVPLQLLRRGTHRSKRIVAFAVLTAAVAISLPLVGDYFDSYRTSSDADTLSERVLIWQFAIEAGQRAPVLGNGFMSFSGTVPSLRTMSTPHAHNDLLSQWAAFGAVGVVLTLCLYWRTLQCALGSRPRSFAIALLSYCFLRGLVESEMSGALAVSPALIVLICMKNPGLVPATDVAARFANRRFPPTLLATKAKIGQEQR